MELLLTALFFTLMVIVIFSLGFIGIDVKEHARIVPAMLWIGVFFSGVLTLSRAFEREREADTLSALLAAPVERLAIYLSKLIVTLCTVLACAWVLAFGLAFSFSGAAPLVHHPLQVAVLLLLGCFGFVAIGVLFAAGLARAGSKNLLLAIIVYPLAMPLLLYSMEVTRRLLSGQGQIRGPMIQLAAADVVVLVVSAALFETMLIGSRSMRKAD